MFEENENSHPISYLADEDKDIQFTILRVVYFTQEIPRLWSHQQEFYHCIPMQWKLNITMTGQYTAVGTYVNDFPWNTMGGAMAAIMQKPMCICTKYHWKKLIWYVWQVIALEVVQFKCLWSQNKVCS